MSETIIHEPMTEIILKVGQARAKFAVLYQRACEAIQDGYPVEIRMIPKKHTRSLQANALLWVRLGEISQQVIWHGHKLTTDEWKEVLSAGLKQQRVLPGIEGGFVVIGARTSKMSIKELNALIELCHAFGAQQGVKFSAYSSIN